MKCKLFSVFLFLVFSQSFAQGTADKKIYLDSLFQESSETTYEYYRIIKNYYSEQQLPFYRISDYYKSGKIAMTGTSKSKEYNDREGQFLYYFENGNKKSAKYYKDSALNGPYSEFYENGNPKMEGEYIPTEKDKKTRLVVMEYWNADNVQQVTGGNGDYEEIEKDEINFGKIKDGFKDGVWSGSNSKIKYTYTEAYADKELISGVSIDSNKVERTYKIVEISPEPKGGIMNFYKYVGKNFRMPMVEGLKGKIFTSFEIDTNGRMINPKIIRSIGYGTDEETLRLLNAYTEKWTPRELRGIKLKATYSLPINIQSAE
jgi:antitoxin component YwqK of YwqJK toxin-antitoxin module